MYTKEKFNGEWFLLKDNRTIAIFDLEREIDVIIKMELLIVEAEKFDILTDTQNGVY